MEGKLSYHSDIVTFFSHSGKFKSRIIVGTENYMGKNPSNQQDTLKII